MIRIVLLLCLVSLPALAQIGPSMGGNGAGGYGGSGMQGSRSGLPAKTQDDDQDKKSDKPAAPPASIPGAEPDADAVVIPSDKVAAEMSPNDALFDAINRGDLAGAKDALNRGAQLDSHNVLGQTPTDASIDLSRNDITFLLLSMRGSVPTHRTTLAATKAPPIRAHGKATLVKATPRPTRQTPVIADRGTPNPAIGFTGF